MLIKNPIKRRKDGDKIIFSVVLTFLLFLLLNKPCKQLIWVPCLFYANFSPHACIKRQSKPCTSFTGLLSHSYVVLIPGNPRVTPEVTRDVCLLARMMAANLYFSQIEDLMFEVLNCLYSFNDWFMAFRF